MGTEENFEDLFEHAPCGYLLLAANGTITRVNATFGAWCGFEPDALIGTPFRDLLNIAGRIYIETHLMPLLRMQGFVHEIALDFVKKNGSKLPILINAMERKDPQGALQSIRITVGYHAIEAADGPTALKILESNVDIDLLITDVGLPGGLSGGQVARAAKEVRPDLKVLFITGFADNAVSGNGHVDPSMPVLTKPFTIESLIDKVRRLLAAGPP